MMSYRNPPVVIIGAGVGGLTLALLLRQRGIAADVLEQSAELHEAGAAVGLAANATRVLRHLGLGEDLARVSAEPTRLIHRDGRDGRTVAASRDNRWYRETFGAPFYGLHRVALQRLLAGAFGPEHLHLGCRAETLTETRAGLRVRCLSGSAFEAGVVVGADGVHSVVRDWVTGGDEPVYSGRSGFRGLVPAERLPSLSDPGALQLWMGPGAHLVHYPINGGSIINFLAVIEGPERWTAPAWMVPAEPGAQLEASRAGTRRSPRCSPPCRSHRAGACSPGGRWPAGAAGRRCCSATRPTRCCRTRARAPTRRSRTRPCWRPNWTARVT
jgi:salicylate hydroxylase